MKSSPGTDFIATGAVAGTWKFSWHVDAERLRDVNAALNFAQLERTSRGFLSHFLAAWLQMSPRSRPDFVVESSLPQDLLYLPSPCLLFARNREGTLWMCWYSTIADPRVAELLSNRAGSRLFTTEGAPGPVGKAFMKALRRLHFREWTREADLIFYRRSAL